MSTHEHFLHFLDNVKDSELYEVEKLKIKFANDLYAILQEQGISNAEFADKIDSSASYVTKVLRGDANFTIATMVKLAWAVKSKVSFELHPDDKIKEFDIKEYARTFLLDTAHTSPWEVLRHSSQRWVRVSPFSAETELQPAEGRSITTKAPEECRNLVYG